MTPDARGVAIDNFNGKVKDTFLKNVSLSGLASQITVLNEASTTALKKLPLNSFDLIYIDGGHDMKTVLSDFSLAWPLLKNGGHLILDDDRETHFGMPDDLKPEKAIDTLLFAYRSELDVLNRGVQAIVRKKADKLKGCTTCSVFGSYVYEWYDYVLTKNGKKVVLTEKEHAQLQKILTSYKFPQNNISPKAPVFSEAQSVQLLRKLGLKPSDFLLNL